MPTSDISVLTIAKGRDEHLRNVLLGLAAQHELPAEMIIGVMNDAPYADLPDVPFPVRQITVTSEKLPLAAARNAVARAAECDKLLFVDVDCIPHPNFVRDYQSHLSDDAGLVMGEVMYLPGGATDGGVDFTRFDALAERHPDRRGPPDSGLDPCNDYRCFWSLNFALTRGTWDRAGGFDERFMGYGGEDTDFGRTVAERGIAINWAKGAKVYHQYHPHAMPPIHHLESVVRNAELFAEKWGHRTMEHWLHAFRLMGLIENTTDGLRILREPDAADYDLCGQQSHQPYATTRKALDILQSYDREKGSGTDRTRDVEKAQSDMLHIAAE